MTDNAEQEIESGPAYLIGVTVTDMQLPPMLEGKLRRAGLTRALQFPQTSRKQLCDGLRLTVEDMTRLDAGLRRIGCKWAKPVVKAKYWSYSDWLKHTDRSDTLSQRVCGWNPVATTQEVAERPEQAHIDLQHV